jgi:hypothetical protein
MKPAQDKKLKIALIVTIVLIGSLVLFLVSRKIASLVKAWKSIQDNKSEQQILSAQGTKLSYPKNWYESQATKLYNSVSWAWYNPNCDEAGTMSVLTLLKNDLDYLELVSAFGMKDNLDMVGWINTCLNQEEKDSVNNIWAGKGITKRL